MALWENTCDDVAYFYSAANIKYGTIEMIGTMQASGETSTSPSSGGEHSYTF